MWRLRTHQLTSIRKFRNTRGGEQFFNVDPCDASMTSSGTFFGRADITFDFKTNIKRFANTRGGEHFFNVDPCDASRASSGTFLARAVNIFYRAIFVR